MESHPEDPLAFLQLERTGSEERSWEGEVREDREVGLGEEGRYTGG
jgi:hypothetical protein